MKAIMTTLEIDEEFGYDFSNNFSDDTKFEITEDSDGEWFAKPIDGGFEKIGIYTENLFILDD